MLSLANNHARDFGEEGRSSSMAALDAVGIHHSGPRRHDGELRSPTAGASPWWRLRPTWARTQLNDPQIGLPLVAELAAKHDIVIVSFHGGAEGNGAEVLPFAREIFAGEDRGNVVRVRARHDRRRRRHRARPRPARGAPAWSCTATGSIAYSLGNFATYYGISVEGIRGLAPILLVTLDDEGRFVVGAHRADDPDSPGRARRRIRPRV